MSYNRQQRGDHDRRGDRRDRYDGRQGRGYRDGGDRRERGEGGVQFQRSYLGKRGRDEVAEDPSKALLRRLLALGDDLGGRNEPDMAAVVSSIEDATTACKRQLTDDSKVKETVELLLDCITDLSSKTPVYVLLIGLINVEHPEFGKQLLSGLASHLSTGLGSHEPVQHDRARLLLRALARLPGVNVVSHSQALGVLRAIADKALGAAQHATSGSEGADATGHTWQAWSDWLVYCVLAALVWGGSELAPACPSDTQELLDVIGQYMELRPVKESPELRLFLDPIKDNDHTTGDCGTPAFLTRLWDAVKGCAEPGADAPHGPWHVASIPDLLAAAPSVVSRVAATQPHDLPTVAVPDSPPQPPPAATGASDGGSAGGAMQVDGAAGTPGAVSVQAAYLAKCFPARCGARLLVPEQTDGTRGPVERFVAEEYILDTLAGFTADRPQCVRTLAAGLPLRYPHAPLLAEVLFTQLLALPKPSLPAIAYHTVLVDLCKVPKLEFPRPMSGCVRECFIRLGVADPTLSPRLERFLAYHLSNFQFQWPWPRWEPYLDAPPTNPQRQFCLHLVRRLATLAHWDKLHGTAQPAGPPLLPPKFLSLLGPSEPTPPKLPGEDGAAAPVAASGATSAGQAAGTKPSGDAGEAGDAAQIEGGDAAADATAGDEPGDAAKQGAARQPDQSAQGPTALEQCALEALSRVRDKVGCEEMVEWLRARGVQDLVGEGPLGTLKVLFRAVLAWGARSASHLTVGVDRYGPALRTLVAACPDAQHAQQAVLQQAAEFYRALPLRALMAADRLLAAHVVSAESAARWTMATALPAALRAVPYQGSSHEWAVLHYMLDRAAERVPETEEKLSRLQQEETAARARARGLQDQAEGLWAQLKQHLASLKPPQPPAAEGGAGNGEGGDTKMEEGGEKVDAGEGEAGEKLAQHDPDVEKAAAQDPRARRLLGAARDADYRASVAVGKADEVVARSTELSATLGPLSLEAQRAVVATFHGFAVLLAAEEERSSAGAGADHQGMDEDPPAGPPLPNAGPGTTAPAVLELLYAQLTAFARRFAAPTAAAAANGALQAALSDVAVPARMSDALAQVLHARVLG